MLLRLILMRHHLRSHYNDSVRVSQYIPTLAISLWRVCVRGTQRRVGRRLRLEKIVQTIKTFAKNRNEENLYLLELTPC